MLLDPLPERRDYSIADDRRKGTQLGSEALNPQFAKRCWKQLRRDEAVRKRLLDFRLQPEVVPQRGAVELYPIGEAHYTRPLGACCLILNAVNLDLEGMTVVLVAVVFNHRDVSTALVSHVPPMPAASHRHLMTKP